MWGIATGTTMGLHRLRMESRPNLAFNVAFLTFNLVAVPSYYFCYRKREHKEEMIELMMRANDFAPLDEMPQPVPLSDHPFLIQPGGEDLGHDRGINEQGTQGGKETKNIKPKEYRGWLKELKEWQRPSKENRDFDQIFQEKDEDAS